MRLQLAVREQPHDTPCGRIGLLLRLASLHLLLETSLLAGMTLGGIVSSGFLAP